jgi:hypothetical protein
MVAAESYSLRNKGGVSLAEGLQIMENKTAAPKWRDPKDRIWCQYVIQPGDRRCRRMFYPRQFWSTACHQHREKVDRLWR